MLDAARRRARVLNEHGALYPWRTINGEEDGIKMVIDVTWTLEGDEFIKGEMHCIIDKKITLHKKMVVLAQSLAQLPHENLFVVPAVRDVIKKYGRKKG